LPEKILLYIIYTEGDTLISRASYHSWRDIQAEYLTYKASLGPWPAGEVIDFLRSEYPSVTDAAEQIRSFLACDLQVATFKLS